MKKIIISLIGVCLIILVFVVTYFKFQNESDLTKIRIAEVTHSIFYAPMYVAIEKGFFEEEGIEIELILTPGADRVAAAVLSNDVEIGFAGPESTIYVYNGGEQDYLVTFAGLTKRDGQFIVSRREIQNFELKDMIGKVVLAGRVGGMPLLNFQHALKNAGIEERDLTINTSVEFAALAGAFIGNNGDFVNLFEPLATKLEKEGIGFIVGSIGQLAGEVPYTCFYARKSFIENNKDLLISFTNAIARGLNFVEENDAETIANAILSQFPDTSLNDLTTIIDRYKKADSWLQNPFITEESFKNLQDIMIDAKQITTHVPFKTLINNLYEK